MNATSTIVNSWFIPIDILMIMCSILIIIVSALFLLIIILDKKCHTVSMMLVTNSCLSALIIGCVVLSFSAFTLQNDIKQIAYQDSLCIFRAFIGYVSYTLFNFSFMLQAFHRYIIVVYPRRLFYQSRKFQFSMICLIWIYTFIYASPFLYTDAVVYNVDNQICQIPLRISFFKIYSLLCTFTIPITLIIFIYWKLLRYVREMRKRIIPINTLIRAKNELKLVRRIVILITILIVVCFPYLIIMFMSFFNYPPKYQYRIAYIFVDSAILCVMIVLFQFTDPLKTSLLKSIKHRSNVIIAVIT